MRSSSSAFGSACSGNALASAFFGVEWSIFAPPTATSWRSAGSLMELVAPRAGVGWSAALVWRGDMKEMPSQSRKTGVAANLPPAYAKNMKTGKKSE
jgi:hypothetical protein